MATTKTADITITADLARAYADALERGYTASILEFVTSEEGAVAASAARDQRNAEMRSLRMGWARAVAKDFKVNGKLTTYSGARAAMLRDWLATVDFDSLPEPTVATTDDAPEATEATE